MKKYMVGLSVLLLAACSSVKPRHAAVDNDDLASLVQCDQIQIAQTETAEKLADLKQQKLGADAGNAVNTAGGLLSFNPLAAFDHTRTGDLEAVIQNYSERLDNLKKLGEAQRCQLNL